MTATDWFSSAKTNTLTSKGKHAKTSPGKSVLDLASGSDINIFCGRVQTLTRFESMLKPDGTIIRSEANWTTKPAPANVLNMLKSLGFTQNNFLTVTEIQELPKEQGFREHDISPQQKRAGRFLSN